MPNPTNLLATYKKHKKELQLKERYFQMFEFRNGITDGVPHSLKETGSKFGISGNRVAQIMARVEYELEQMK